MKKRLEELIKKVHGLTDFREAIKEVKKASLEKAHNPDPAVDVKQEQKQHANVAITGLGAHAIKHLGIDTTKPGTISHMVGMPGQANHYRINYDMHEASKGNPAFSVHLADAKGAAHSRHPEVHGDIGNAVKAVVSHAFKGKWE